MKYDINRGKPVTTDSAIKRRSNGDRITERKVESQAALQVQSDALRLAQDNGKIYEDYLASEEVVTGFG